MFTEAEIKARIKQQPFVPLRIVTSSGETFDVFHPDNVMAGRREVIIGNAAADNPASFEGISRVAILRISALHDLSAKISPSGRSKPQQT
jgi:hypothetical protein